MSKIMPPMSNVKTRAIRKSRKNSFTGRGFYHTQLAVGKSLVLNDQSDRGGGALGAHSHIQKHASHPDDRRPSKFIVLADNMKSAINRAWEHGGADFQSLFDKSAGQAQEMKEGALRVL
jgi:hypothetical protein